MEEEEEEGMLVLSDLNYAPLGSNCKTTCLRFRYFEVLRDTRQDSVPIITNRIGAESY